MPEMIDFREFAKNWADQAESFHQNKDSNFSPEGILKHPDLLQGGWGWNRLMPRFGNLDWSVYRNYLEQYYLRNCAESVGQAWQNEQVSGLSPLGILTKNGSIAEACLDKQEAYANGIGDGSVLASLASLCVKMEKQFISECNKWGFGDNAADHIILSKDIQERALSLKNMGDKFPVAAAALMFITKKAELMCEWLRRGAFTPESMITAVRRCVLNLMMYRGSGYACAAALMMGIAKETKTLCDCLRKDDPAANLSVTVMKNGWESLAMLHDEFLPAGNDDGQDRSLEEYFAQLSKGEDAAGGVERRSATGGEGTTAQAITLASSQDPEGAEVAAGEDTVAEDAAWCAVRHQIKTECEHMLIRLRQGPVPREELIASFEKILHLCHSCQGWMAKALQVKNEDVKH